MCVQCAGGRARGCTRATHTHTRTPTPLLPCSLSQLNFWEGCLEGDADDFAADSADAYKQGSVRALHFKAFRKPGMASVYDAYMAGGRDAAYDAYAKLPRDAAGFATLESA